MIDSISGASAAYPASAPPARKQTQTPAAPDTVVAASTAGEAAMPAASAASLAGTRLGDTLNAQADAARVQRAVDAAMPAEAAKVAGEDGAAVATGVAGEASSAAADPAASDKAPPAAPGGASASGQGTDADYIAAADTNADQTVSDQERAVYEAKQRRMAEEDAQAPAAATDPRTAEVRAAYGLDAGTAPALDIVA